MEIYSRYSPGTANPLEDQLVIRAPFYGVADGVSGLYLPNKGPTLFNGRTGGQMACDILLQEFAKASPNDSLKEVLYLANSGVGRAQVYPLEEAEFLASAAFAAAKITDSDVEIIQTGDCFAAWETDKGGFGATRNQVFLHDQEMRQRIKELMEKYGSDRTKMWQKFSPFLAAKRRERINNNKALEGYGLFNGQPQSRALWERIILPRKEIKALLLFTDGLIHYPDSGDQADFARKIFGLYQKGGLDRILAETRKAEEKEKATSHIDHAEATAIAIEL